MNLDFEQNIWILLFVHLQPSRENEASNMQWGGETLVVLKQQYLSIHVSSRVKNNKLIHILFY